MKQTKHKYCTSIWAHPKKGVKAGNSPVWNPDEEITGTRKQAMIDKEAYLRGDHHPDWESERAHEKGLGHRMAGD